MRVEVELSDESIDRLADAIATRLAATLGDQLKPTLAPNLSLREVATALGVSQETVRRAIDRGELIASRVGAKIRISSSDLEAYVEAQRIAPAEPAPARGNRVSSSSPVTTSFRERAKQGRGSLRERAKQGRGSPLLEVEERARRDGVLKD